MVLPAIVMAGGRHQRAQAMRAIEAEE